MLPFTYHWYAGAGPPYIGNAVNVTGTPLQTGFPDAVMKTLTGRFCRAVIQIVFDDAGFPVGQGTFEVRMH